MGAAQVNRTDVLLLLFALAAFALFAYAFLNLGGAR